MILGRTKKSWWGMHVGGQGGRAIDQLAKYSKICSIHSGSRRSDCPVAERREGVCSQMAKALHAQFGLWRFCPRESSRNRVVAALNERPTQSLTRAGRQSFGSREGLRIGE
jgi:hypothetical protein